MYAAEAGQQQAQIDQQRTALQLLVGAAAIIVGTGNLSIFVLLQSCSRNCWHMHMAMSSRHLRFYHSVDVATRRRTECKQLSRRAMDTDLARRTRRIGCRTDNNKLLLSFYESSG